MKSKKIIEFSNKLKKYPKKYSKIINYLDKLDINMLPYSEDILLELIEYSILNEEENIKINRSIEVYNFFKINPNFKEQIDVLNRLTINDHISLDNQVYEIYNLFNNKKIFLSIIELANNDLDYIYEYIIRAKKYYVDEKAFYSSVFSLINQINNSEEQYDYDDIQKLINIKLYEDTRISGLFGKNREDLELAFNKLQQLNKQQSIIGKNINKIEEELTRVLNKVNKKIEQSDNEKISALEEIGNILYELKLNFNVVDKPIIDNKYDIKNKCLDILKEVKSDTGINDVSELDSIMLEYIMDDLIKNNEFHIELYKIWYYALYNNTTHIIEHFSNFELKDYKILLNKNIINKIGEEKYYKLIKSDRSHLIVNFVEANEIDFLKEIIETNPDFDYSVNKNIFIKKLKIALNKLGMEVINNPVFENNMHKLFYRNDFEKTLNYYKEIYLINPNFEIYLPIEKYIEANIFTVEEIALLSYKKQSIIDHMLLNYHNLEEYGKYKEELKKIFLTENEELTLQEKSIQKLKRKINKKN